jgi:hypothetical protein
VQTDAPSKPARPESAAASDGSSAFLLALAIDALRRPGQRLDSLCADRLPARVADSVRALVDALERGVDRSEQAPLVLLEAVIELSVEGDRGDVGRVVVGRAVLGLVLNRARVLLVEVVDRLLDPLALFEQPLLEVLGVDRRAQG